LLLGAVMEQETRNQRSARLNNIREIAVSLARLYKLDAVEAIKAAKTYYAAVMEIDRLINQEIEED